MAQNYYDFDVRIAYADTDRMGVVYYANYLKFAERGRSEMLRSFGFPHRKLGAEDGVVFAVRRCSIEYLAPALRENASSVRTAWPSAGADTWTLP